MRKLLTIIVVVVSGPLALAQNYGYQQYNYRTKTVVVGVPLAPDYYYSVGDGDPEEHAKRIADEVLKRLKKEFVTAGEVETKPAPLDRSAFQVLGKPNDLDNKVLAIFNDSCVKCHKPGANKPGNIQLFTNDRRLWVDPDPKRELVRRETVYSSIDHSVGGSMPKGQPPLPMAKLDIIKEWVDTAKAVAQRGSK
jgi:hypothetical protein